MKPPLLLRNRPVLQGPVVTTLVEWGDRRLKFLQVSQGRGGLRLLALKTLPLQDSQEGSALKQVAATLPVTPRRVILLLPKSKVLTRLLTLPAEDPGELATMARYQLAGDIPYPIQDCSVAVQVLSTSEGKTRVLAAVIPKSFLERLLTLLKQAGLEPQAVALSSEGLVYWHETLTSGVPSPRLVVEVSDEALDLAIVDRKSLLEVRTLPLPPEGVLSLEWLLSQIQDTLLSYGERKIGPKVAAVTLGGKKLTGPGVLASLQEHLGLPVALTDPFVSPFKQTLADQAAEIARSSFSPILGLAVHPEVSLNLLPADIQRLQSATTCLNRAIWAVAWCALCLWLGAAVLGVRAYRLQEKDTRLRVQIVSIQAQAVSREVLAQRLASVQKARRLYEATLEWVESFQAGISPLVVLESVALDANQLKVSGSTSQLPELTSWAGRLEGLRGLRAVSITRMTGGKDGRISFELEGVLEVAS